MGQRLNVNVECGDTVNVGMQIREGVGSMGISACVRACSVHAVYVCMRVCVCLCIHGYGSSLYVIDKNGSA